jgi:hypothetical protein
MWMKMQYVTIHGDGRLLFERDIPKEPRPVAGRTTWQRSLGARDWNATFARDGAERHCATPGGVPLDPADSERIAGVCAVPAPLESLNCI